MISIILFTIMLILLSLILQSKLLGVLSIITAFLAILFYLFWKLYFLRDPERKTTKDGIICPADGKVVEITKFDFKKKDHLWIKKGIFGKVKSPEVSKGILISIFMNPLSVHVNRSPIDGEIISTKHHRGKFLPAYEVEDSILENEKNIIHIKNSKIQVFVIQIAGFLARRIVGFVKKGQKIKKGQRIGLINLGSQVSVILPDNLKINVKRGDKVFAGQTIIAK